MLTALSVRLNGVIGGEVARRKELQRELTAAQQVQRSLAPDGLPLERRIDIAGCNRMCRDVGGDYYDAFFVGHDQLLMVIADVSGKGAAAALVTASVQAIVRTHAASCQLRELATLLDRHLQRFGAGHYVTSVLLRLDLSSGDLAYVNAGHNPPLVISSGFVSRLDGTSPALGLLDDAMFTASSFTLPADSVLVLYTDGVTERRGAGDAEYGDARLLAAIQTGMQGSASQIVGAIVRDNDRFSQLAAADDDLTVLVAKRRREIRKSYRPTTHAYRHRHRRRSDARRRAALSLLLAGHSDFANSRAWHDPATSTLSVRRDPCGRLTTM
jgi:phosphoserine phosphatase RsbU/P